MNIAIVDDRPEDRERLDRAIRAYFAEEKKEISIKNYASAEEMLADYSPDMFQMAFLDIVMDEMTGVDLAKELRAMDAHLLIVFQTTSREYAFDAFPVHPFDYLMKPVEEAELTDVLEEAQRVVDAGDPEIIVSSTRGTFQVPLRTIVSVVSQGHNVKLSLTNSQEILSTETFRTLSEKLESDSRFLLINRGLIINMDHVLAPDEDSFRMQDGTVCHIKVNGRAQVLSEFAQYMISRIDRRPR